MATQLTAEAFLTVARYSDSFVVSSLQQAAAKGGMQRIADKTFLLTPANVEVSAEEKARLVEKGFFNQS
jgi:hypothetical protein